MIKQAGELNQRLTLKRKVAVPDEMGGQITQWNAVRDVWANVRPMRGGERFNAAQLQSDATYVLTMRDRDDVTDADVFDHATLGRFEVTFVKRTPRARFMEVECSLGGLIG